MPWPGLNCTSIVWVDNTDIIDNCDTIAYIAATTDRQITRYIPTEIGAGSIIDTLSLKHESKKFVRKNLCNV